MFQEVWYWLPLLPTPAAMIEHGLVRWDAPVRGSGRCREEDPDEIVRAVLLLRPASRNGSGAPHGIGLHYNACDVSGQEVMMSSQELLVRTVGKCRPTHSVIVVHVFARACLGR